VAVGAHLVFHLAGFSRVDESFRQVGECFDVNAKGTALLVEATRGAEAFVYASTSEVYGSAARAPFEESALPMPDSPYAIAKLAGEHACFARQRGQRDRSDATRFAVLRFFNVFGPRQRGPSIVASTVAACVAGAPVRTTKGEQTRDFLYVDDAVDALVAGAERGADGPVNVCTGREVAVRDVVAAVARISATTSTVDVGALPYRAHETWRAFGDATRAERVLGFRARVPFDEALARTIAWAKTAPPSLPPSAPPRA
jgi:UDP-glucose 4-epimerase